MESLIEGTCSAIRRPAIAGRLWRALAATAVLAASGSNPAAATDFYQGKTISIIVAYPPGDGSDVYARLLTRHLGAHIPGNPSFVVHNRPGASGLLGSNHLYNVAPKDGLTFSIISRSVAIQQITGNTAIKFDAGKFSWIGTASSYQNDAYGLIVRDGAGIKTLDDLRTSARPILFGTSATPGDSFYDIPQIARELWNLNIKLVKGYSSPETILAMDRGEIDGRGIGISALSQFRPDWVKGIGARFIVQFGHQKRWEGMADVPTAYELTSIAADRELISMVELPLLMARPYAAPPGIPADRLQILRQAFMAAHRDPAFLAEAAKLNLEISARSGSDVDAMIANVNNVRPETVQRYIKALARQ
ncbi:MAG: hypothetical protein IT536_03825 [Hyphomicrobiales bacterium]|nr:hypothetical protein [Hyphomicrobiales bacterium]